MQEISGKTKTRTGAFAVAVILALLVVFFSCKGIMFFEDISKLWRPG